MVAGSGLEWRILVRLLVVVTERPSTRSKAVNLSLSHFDQFRKSNLFSVTGTGLAPPLLLPMVVLTARVLDQSPLSVDKIPAHEVKKTVSVDIVVFLFLGATLWKQGK